MRSFWLGGVLGLVVAASFAHADDWPQFLGSRRDGISREKGLNWDWKKTPPKVAWKVPIGSGFSGLSVVGDKVYTMTQRGTRDIVLCLNAADGKELWTYDAVDTYVDRQKQGAGPRATPTYHDGKLYCLFAMGDLFCLTAEGKKLWQTNIFETTGAKDPVGEFYYWGVSFSPLVEGDLVVVQPGGDKNNSVAAYHKDTGKLVWSAGSGPLGYASPIAITVKNTRQIVAATGASILGLEPAGGKVLWNYTFGNKFNATAATPVWSEPALFVSAAYGTGAARIEIVADGSGWAVQEKWKNKKSLQNLFATSILHDGKLYGCHGDLAAWTMRCVDFTSGQILWEERSPSRIAFLGVDGHLLGWDERGNLSAVALTSRGYELKGELPKLLTYKSWAAPSFSGGKLFLRDERHALCLDLR